MAEEGRRSHHLRRQGAMERRMESQRNFSTYQPSTINPDELYPDVGKHNSKGKAQIEVSLFQKAEKASWNSIGIFKISNISGKRRELVPSKRAADDTDMDSESDDSDEDDDAENGGSGAPVFQICKVSHEGCVNRIRAMTQSPHVCASWADSGYVRIWDFSSHLNALAESETDISGVIQLC